jgi:hypothetical protein
MTYIGKPIRTIADFSIEILKAKRPWNEVFQVLTENKFKHRLATQQSYHL